jgi:hypothetical protein
MPNKMNTEAAGRMTTGCETNYQFAISCQQIDPESLSSPRQGWRFAGTAGFGFSNFANLKREGAVGDSYLIYRINGHFAAI